MTEELIREVGTNKTVNNVTDPLTTLNDEDYKGIILKYKTDFKLMVAQQSGKGPNLKVVKWW